MVDVFERLGFFRVFSAPWFVLLLTVLVVSIVCCTLDRTPDCGARRASCASRSRRRSSTCAWPSGRCVEHARCWRPTTWRASSADATSASACTRPSPPAQTWVYGDRNQYFKLATLLTHLGLILFLLGGAVTSAFGFETVVFVGEGQTAPVQPVGTPDNLLVKNIDFEAPQRADGSFADFSTDLAVYQNGAAGGAQDDPRQRPARGRRLRLPPEHVRARAPMSRSTTPPAGWCGPARCSWPATLAGKPQGFMTIPGLRHRAAARCSTGPPTARRCWRSRASGRPTPAAPATIAVPDRAGHRRHAATPAATAGYTITWTSAGAWTGMVIKNDPGQGIVWLAFLRSSRGWCCRSTSRAGASGRASGRPLQLAMLADRYVDVPREFRGPAGEPR